MTNCTLCNLCINIDVIINCCDNPCMTCTLNVHCQGCCPNGGIDKDAAAPHKQMSPDYCGVWVRVALKETSTSDGQGRASLEPRTKQDGGHCFVSCNGHHAHVQHNSHAASTCSRQLRPGLDQRDFILRRRARATSASTSVWSCGCF